jgi:hypothetical protein
MSGFSTSRKVFCFAIAWTIYAASDEIIGWFPELLAHHCTRAAWRGLALEIGGSGDANLQNSRGIILSVSEREVAWRNIGVMLGRVDAA